MKLSRFPFKTSKSRGTDEFTSIEMLFQSGQLKRHSAGVYGFGPLLSRAHNKLVDLTRCVMNEFGGVEVTLPLVQAKPLWTASGRWEAYKKADTTFYSKGRDNEYFFAPTAEEFMADIMKGHITSYKDLNFNVYQIGRKFRDEIRVRGGLTRSKEFMMYDGYSFSDTQEAMEAEYDNMKRAYIELFRRIGMDAKPVIAINDFGGKVSEEIVVISNMGSDKILICKNTGIAVNSEILENAELLADIKSKNQAFDIANAEEHTGIELGHIFQLDQFYSRAMDIKFTRKDGKSDYAFMGCYGIGIGRALNVALENNIDTDGLVYPDAIAPYTIGIVNLDNDAQKQMAGNLYDFYNKNGVETIWDDREISLGMKIKDMLLHGIPYIVIVGKQSDGTIFETEHRKTREKFNLTKEELLARVK